MELSSMIARARAEVREAEEAATSRSKEAEAAQAAAAEAQEHLRSKQTVLDWLQQQEEIEASPMSSVAQGVAEEAPSSPGGGPVVNDDHNSSKPMLFGRPAPAVTNTELCLQALAKLAGPASTRDVRMQLAQDGYDRTQEQVRSTLKYLLSKERVRNVGTGQWEVTSLRRRAARVTSVNGQGFA